MPRPVTSPGTPQVALATASVAIATLLDGPVTAGRVLASGPRAVTVQVGGPGARVLSVATRAAVRLPCGLVLAGDGVPLAGVEPGAAALVGGGAVLLPARRGAAACLLEIRPGRWWDPRPRLGAVEPAGVAGALEAVEALLPPWPTPGVGPRVGAALVAGRAGLEAAAGWAGLEAVGPAAPARLARAARGLVGLGPGSTPSGDDLVAGVMAAARLVGEGLGARGAVALADALATATRPLLAGTTTLSAALLEHAARAEVCAPAAALCRALAGDEPLRAAVDGLLAVGHTSGSDLAAGLASGARLALRYAGSGWAAGP